MNGDVRKYTCGHVHPGKNQIGQWIHCSDFGQAWMHSFFMWWRLMGLPGSAGWFESSVGAHVRRYIFSCCGICFLGKNKENGNTVTVLKFRTLYSILFRLKFCFLCICLLKCLVEWQTVNTQIRLLLQEQSDLGLHCLHMAFCQKLWYSKCLDIYHTLNILKFNTPKLLIKWHVQIVQTQIRQLLSDQDLHCLPFH